MPEDLPDELFQPQRSAAWRWIGIVVLFMGLAAAGALGTLLAIQYFTGQL